MKTAIGLSSLFSLCTLSVLVASAFIDFATTEEDTLVLLHVLFRHGNRTPEKDGQYPNDPYLNMTFEPYGHGQLTAEGKKTEYEIGEYLRLTYGKFIPEQYFPGVAKALTTDFDRTKMSLELVLASLFPPLLTDLFGVNLNWQPIPFDIDQGDGVLGPAFLHCQNYIQEYDKYIQSEEGLAVIDSYKEVYQRLSVYTGMNITEPSQLQEFYATLNSELDYGLELPEWVPEMFPSLEDATCAYYEVATANAVLKKYAAGFLLKKILDDSISRRNGTLSEKTKIFLYSAHEFNVGAVLRILNLFEIERQVPPFGATIFFEIHNVSDIYYLKLYYQNYKEATPSLLAIPGCGSLCELDQLSHLMQDYLPGSDDKCS